MQLNNFLHLINDLDPSYTIYFEQEKNGPKWPISKVNLTSSKCIFVAQKNKQAKSIESVIKLLNKINSKNIPLTVLFDNEEYSFFGIQINPSYNLITIF